MSDNNSVNPWKTMTQIPLSLFQVEGQLTGGITFMNSKSKSPISAASLRGATLVLEVEQNVLKPKLILKRDGIPDNPPLDGVLFPTPDVTPQSLRERINRILDSNTENPPVIGKRRLATLYSRLNWYTLSESESEFGEIFNIFNERTNNRVSHFTMSTNVMGTIENFLHEITEIKMFFGISYGRVQGKGLVFSPVLYLNANLFERPTCEVETKILCQEEDVEIIGGGDGSTEGTFFFNYLRPCPPFGDCD